MQEIKVNGYTVYIDTEFGGLYDMDDKGNVSKVLHLFGLNRDGKDTLHFSRFPYSSKDGYRLATEDDVKDAGCMYFDEEGNRPLKRKVCDKSCEHFGECFMEDSKVKKYIANYNVK